METAQLKERIRNPCLCICAWIDDEQFTCGPSQLFYWRSGETLGGMLERVQLEHRATYGTGGRLADSPGLDEASFMETAEGIGRFILAGMTWLRQRVVIEASEPLERHRRKDYVRRTGQQEPRVQVISLRRAVSKQTEHHETDRHLSVRFMVGLESGGFFRNQACGPKMGDRRLTFIAPFMKGPEDAPLKLPNVRVFTVNR
jgi:hypothetical protein